MVLRASLPKPKKTSFFDLPSELRLRIYDFVLLSRPRTIDLDPLNYRQIAPRLTCFLVCHRMHEETYPIFYGSHDHPIRLFPLKDRFFHKGKPILSRIGPRYRAAVTTCELRLGPGWSAPPKSWHTGESLGLVDCVSLRTLKIFIEIDPSNQFFEGFRGKGNTKESYQIFCVGILRGIMEQVPSLKFVELDAYPSVTKDAPLVLALVRQIYAAGRRVVWGPLRGWEEKGDGGGQIGLENAMAAIRL